MPKLRRYRVQDFFDPINPQRKIGVGYTDNNQGDDIVLAASSFHPGGANFGFADGSVRFLKDFFQSCQLVGSGTTSIPDGWPRDDNGTFAKAIFVRDFSLSSLLYFDRPQVS